MIPINIIAAKVPNSMISINIIGAKVHRFSTGI